MPLSPRLQSAPNDFAVQTFTDPAINAQIQILREKITALESKVAEKEEEIKGLKFTNESLQGKQLQRKCKLLSEEREKLKASDNVKAVAEAVKMQKLAENYPTNLRAKLKEALDLNKQLQADNARLQQQLEETQLRKAEPEDKMDDDDEREPASAIKEEAMKNEGGMEEDKEDGKGEKEDAREAKEDLKKEKTEESDL
ncbi:unnamed protein product [Chrysoparadoxa australica]